jgi:hypothetical protein
MNNSRVRHSETKRAHFNILTFWRSPNSFSFWSYFGESRPPPPPPPPMRPGVPYVVRVACSSLLHLTDRRCCYRGSIALLARVAAAILIFFSPRPPGFSSNRRPRHRPPVAVLSDIPVCGRRRRLTFQVAAGTAAAAADVAAAASSVGLVRSI